MGDNTAFHAFAVRLAAGDDSAAAELLARYSARLVALARRRMSPKLLAKDDPEDVLQSVLRTFFRRLDAGEFEPRGWGGLWGFLSLMTLRKIQRNANHFAAARRDATREVPLQVSRGGDEPWELCIPNREPTPEEAAAFADELESLLTGLSDRDRAAVEMLLAGESTESAADQLGVSERTVQRTVVRLRTRLLAREQRAEGRAPPLSAPVS